MPKQPKRKVYRLVKTLIKKTCIDCYLTQGSCSKNVKDKIEVSIKDRENLILMWRYSVKTFKETFLPLIWVAITYQRERLNPTFFFAPPCNSRWTLDNGKMSTSQSSSADNSKFPPVIGWKSRDKFGIVRNYWFHEESSICTGNLANMNHRKKRFSWRIGSQC